MPNQTAPDQPRQADLDEAGAWLQQHGLTDARPTALLATRLAVRRRARVVSSVLLALFIIAISLLYTVYYGSGQDRQAPLLLVTAVVAALVAGLWLLDWWVRRTDRRAGATLLRRAAHPVRLGWRTVLGLPRAAFAAAMFAGVLVPTVATLAAGDPAARNTAAVLLIGVCGIATGLAVQLRHVLTHPAVADDEDSLTADAIMRVEDAREVAVPSVLWCLPVPSLLDAVPGWWMAAWLAFIVLGVVALALISARTASSGTVARHTISAG
jgi:hypothetical protein